MANQIDPMALPGPHGWANSVEPTPDLSAYLSHEVGLDRTFAVAKLLWPEFIEVRGCVCRLDAYQPDQFERWWTELEGDIKRIELVTNHLHLWDLFDAPDELSATALDELASIIARSWEAALSRVFPGRAFDVARRGDPEDYGPTIEFSSK